jgi:hypothetical protein
MSRSCGVDVVGVEVSGGTIKFCILRRSRYEFVSYLHHEIGDSLNSELAISGMSFKPFSIGTCLSLQI